MELENQSKKIENIQKFVLMLREIMPEENLLLEHSQSFVEIQLDIFERLVGEGKITNLEFLLNEKETK
jgi:hypothetical protein